MTVDFKTLEQLKTIFSAEQFILTGSVAVSFLGFKNIKASKDIDILLYNPTTECMDKLKEFQDKFPRTNKSGYDNPNMFQFLYNDINFDVFITKEKYDESLTYKNIIISSIDKIALVKKGYNSPKHIFQLMNWRNQIISDIEINKFTSII